MIVLENVPPDHAWYGNTFGGQLKFCGRGGLSSGEMRAVLFETGGQEVMCSRRNISGYLGLTGNVVRVASVETIDTVVADRQCSVGVQLFGGQTQSVDLLNNADAILCFERGSYGNGGDFWAHGSELAIKYGFPVKYVYVDGGALVLGLSKELGPIDLDLARSIIEVSRNKSGMELSQVDCPALP